MAEKANPTASASEDLAVFPQGQSFIDGVPVHPHGGGVVLLEGEPHSVSRPELVASGMQAAGEGGILARRTGRITLANYGASQPTTFGGEAEYAALDPDTGRYTARFGFDLELYNFMVETSTRVAGNQNEVLGAYADMSAEVVSQAEDKGVLLLPTSVFGQRTPEAADASPHPYVKHTVSQMDRFTGFSALDMFRVAGFQPHTRISNLRAALQAAEAMQLLNPILMAPSLTGPLLEGGPAAHLSGRPFTSKQLEHLQNAGITEEDLSRRYESYRYLLRRIGSPSSGIWHHQAPDTVEEYLADAHWQLAAGEINTADRFRGWHSDRVRAILDGSGNTTFESCVYDSFAGNVTAMADNHSLLSGTFTALETKAIRGDDVVEEVARELQINHLNRDERLKLAHRASIQVSRNGTNGGVYGKLPGTWLVRSLLPLTELSPYVELDMETRMRLVGNFATIAETLPALNNWCKDNRTVTPDSGAYYELGLGSPSYYMRQHRDSLVGMPPEEKVRRVELTMAQRYHAHVGQLALA